MKIKANGIAFNYEISGADKAPWLIFSNSLATNLHMWDRRSRTSRTRSACWPTTSAVTA
jgi:3-oxoadipate enol-lactonase